MQDITAQIIIPPFIIKQIEQTHPWCKLFFLNIFQLKQTKYSYKGVLLQVELHPCRTYRTSGDIMNSAMLVHLKQ